MSRSRSSRLSPQRSNNTASTELPMLEIEVAAVEEDEEDARSVLLAQQHAKPRRRNTPEQNLDHRQQSSLASGYYLLFDSNNNSNPTMMKHNYNATTTPSRTSSSSSMLGGGTSGMNSKSGGVGESSGISSCNASVTTRSTADVTSSSCDSSLTTNTARDGAAEQLSQQQQPEQDQFMVLEESLEISAVDTHTSILNITEDDDDEDDDDDNENEEENQQANGDQQKKDQEQPLDQDNDEDDEPPLIDVGCPFEAALHPDDSDDFAPQCPSTSASSGGEEGRCIPADGKKTGLAFVENMVDRFVEHLCFSSYNKNKGGADLQQQQPDEDVLEKVERDMTTLLGGCLGPDSVTEMKHAQCMLNRLLCHHPASSSSASAQQQQAPRRNTKGQRMRRLQKLQEERGRDGLNVYAVRSMQEQLRKSASSRCSSHNHNPDDSGYDSDPDDVLLVSSSPFNKMNEERSPSPSSVTDMHHPNDMMIPQADWQEHLHPIVQESLNSVWDLTWHQPPSSSASSSTAAATATSITTTTTSTPVRVTAWMERGTIIKNNSVMIEPRLMWKPAASSKKNKSNNNKNNTQTPPPVSIQLMHICRVLPATDKCLDRHQHPLARPSTSLIVRTTTRDRHRTNDYVFQASSAAERDALVHRWKVTVARFATLAVLEDAETLLREFFVPPTAAAAFPAPLRRSSVC